MRKLFTHSVMATALALALALPSPAGASGQQICHGAGELICAPIAVVGALAPESSENKIIDAINKPDLDALEKLLAWHPNAVKSYSLFQQAISDYVDAFAPNPAMDEAESTRRLSVVDYLLTHRTDIQPEALSTLLTRQMLPQQPAAQARLVTVAKLLIAHGGSYAKINLDNYSTGPAISAELLTLMLEHGAHANQEVRDGHSVALNYLLNNKLEPAELLLQHGADPNLPSANNGESGLPYLASQCVRQARQNEDPVATARIKSKCEQRSARQFELLAKYGADLNGKRWGEPIMTVSGGKIIDCTTTWQAARETGNLVLAERLVQLGAEPKLCESMLIGAQ